MAEENEFDPKVNFFHNKNYNDLYDEKRSLNVSILFSIRRVQTKKSDCWEILENDDVKMIILSKRLTKQERKLLSTAKGMNLILNLYKSGLKAVSGMRRKMQETLKVK